MIMEERLGLKDNMSNEEKMKEAEARLQSNESEGGKNEKLGDAGNLAWLLGLGLSLLPSNHLDLSPRWQQWFLRLLHISFNKVRKVSNNLFSGASQGSSCCPVSIPSSVWGPLASMS